jgi:hypothetical protein
VVEKKMVLFLRAYINIFFKSSRHIFFRKSSVGSFVTHLQVSHHTPHDNSKEKPLLQNTISLCGLGIFLGCGWDDWNNWCRTLGGLGWSGCSSGRSNNRDFSRLFLSRLELCMAIFFIWGAQMISMPNWSMYPRKEITPREGNGRRCFARKKVLYSSTWIPSSGTGNSPLLVILTGFCGLSPGPLGTFSIA